MRAVDTELPGRELRIALVDDHVLYRAGLRGVLEQEPGLAVVGEAGNDREATRLLDTVPVDLMIVDLVLPGPGGVTVTREAKRQRPAIKVLLLSMIEEPYRVAEALRAGASGYALKSQPTDEILEAVQAMRGADGGIAYLAPRLSREQVLSLIAPGAGGPLDVLSQREREVFDLLVRGHSSASIAATLFLSERTVEAHRQHIMGKLGTHSAVGLVRLAARLGLVGGSEEE